MGNYELLKAAINEVIKANGRQEITGEVLNQVLLSMVNSLGAGYQCMGVATPSTNPGTSDQNVFYFATQAGTYTNFDAIVLQAGISVLIWDGEWASQTWFTVDSTPTNNSQNLIASGAVFNALKLDGGAYDVTAHNSGATFASLSALLNSENLATLIPTEIRHGGMSIKFVLSSDNKYVQCRLMANSWSTTVSDWQGVDSEPVAGSDNLVKSGGVYKGEPKFNSYILKILLAQIPDWAENTDYKVGNRRKYSNRYYLCKTNHTSGNSFDSTKWTEIDFSYLSENQNMLNASIIHLSAWGDGNITCPVGEFLYYTTGYNSVLYHDIGIYRIIPYAKGVLYEYEGIYYTFDGEKLIASNIENKTNFIEKGNITLFTIDDDYNHNAVVTDSIMDLGVWYTVGTQNNIRGLQISSITGNFEAPGVLSILKCEDLLDYEPILAPITTVQSFNITKNGIQTLYLDTPIILNDNEWIGFKMIGGHILCKTNASIPESGVYYKWNGTPSQKWLYNENSLNIGINTVDLNGKDISRFRGKRIAILGDSISTYQGFVPQTYQYFYPSNSCPDVDYVGKTFWKIVAESLGLKVTNASYSGSTCAVTGGYGVVGCSDERISALGENENPDIVLCFIGINDWGYGRVDLGEWTPHNAIPSEGNTFANAYTLMLSKIQIAYPRAKVFCCTLLPDKARDSDHQWPLINSRGEYLSDYNEAIRIITKGMGCNLIELSACGINWNTIDDFFGDYSATYGIHPNAAGHQLMARQIISALKAIF